MYVLHPQHGVIYYWGYLLTLLHCKNTTLRMLWAVTNFFYLVSTVRMLLYRVWRLNTTLSLLCTRHVSRTVSHWVACAQRGNLRRPWRAGCKTSNYSGTNSTLSLETFFRNSPMLWYRRKSFKALLMDWTAGWTPWATHWDSRSVLQQGWNWLSHKSKDLEWVTFSDGSNSYLVYKCLTCRFDSVYNISFWTSNSRKFMLESINA